MKKVVVIGAGPSGLCAALELVDNEDIQVEVYESETQLGGLSRTLEFDGNKIDIGPHRFFSKSSKIVDIWKKNDSELLLKERYTRIYFLNKFFDYPLSINAGFFYNLGFVRLFKIVLSYLKNYFIWNKKEENLEDFFINRFGKELYLTFFKNYTEKVWGIPCNEIANSWGRQRVKELSVFKILKDNLSFKKRKKLEDYFYYPKSGSGRMWELIAQKIDGNGGKIFTGKEVVSIKNSNEKVEAIMVKDLKTGDISEVSADYVISSMPIQNLINQMKNVDKNVLDIANKLQYRDIIIIGLVFKKFKGKYLKDNWIYLQNENTTAARMEIYNNFSEDMLHDKNTINIGLEYFCNKNDELWQKSDDEIMKFAISELAQINIFNAEDFITSKVYRVEKAYPAYIGAYEKFNEIRHFTDKFDNLILIGRNGMHRYNNMDHAMLSGIMAAQNILSGKTDNSNVWDINIEEQYLEN